MAMMTGTKVQQDAFTKRLGRIASGGENTTRQLHVGPAHEAVGKNGKSRAIVMKQSGGRRRSFLGEAFILPVALAVGAVSVLAARVISYRFLADQSYYSAEIYGISGAALGVIGIAVVLCALLRVTLKLTGGSRGKAVVVGFLAMAFLEDLVIARAPELFVSLYSEAYVAEVLAKLGSTATF